MIILFGLGVGILIGLTGIGGGSLMTPLLLLFVGTPPVTAIGTDLAYGAVTKTFGGWQHLRRKTVDLGLCWWMAAGSVPGSLVGVWLIERLHHVYGDNFDDVLLVFVAVALLVTAVATLGRALFMPSAIAREQETVEMTRRRKAQAIVIGFVLGLVLGLTSVGSGALIGLALILVFQLTPHRVVGTDVFHAAILLWVAGLAHFAAGNVDLVLMTNILLGSIPGVWLGTHLITRVPARALRPTLGCVLMAAGIGVLTKAGVAVPPWALVGVPVAVGLGVIGLERRRSLRLPTPGGVPAPAEQ
ncbi:sulfite exporter TauE/SafE family protein [Svornostia abyssi]|uniref:Probable membrane transporter protein n=1 Tax=Svornostia abyssi TaxID=2898438 RepID=A0ABY5PFQ1_9ACTN|nr:sulfite exporter TauE/SafE family protein [Parviterribacteraceae bacterium J379]